MTKDEALEQSAQDKKITGQCIYCRAFNGHLDGCIYEKSEQPAQEPDGCENCHACLVNVKTEQGWPATATRMIVCPECGNKRCPKASNHRYDCTHSNDVGQLGSIYSNFTPPPAQEPVAFITERYDIHYTPAGKGLPVGTKLYTHTAPQPAQEPVGWYLGKEKEYGYDLINLYVDIEESTDLYTHPHQWQGLTDDDVKGQLFGIRFDRHTHTLMSNPPQIKYSYTMEERELFNFARAIEQALKEKNHG